MRRTAGRLLMMVALLAGAAGCGGREPGHYVVPPDGLCAAVGLTPFDPAVTEVEAEPASRRVDIDEVELRCTWSLRFYGEPWTVTATADVFDGVTTGAKPAFQSLAGPAATPAASAPATSHGFGTWTKVGPHGYWSLTEPTRPAGGDLRGDLRYEVAWWDGNLVARVQLGRPVLFTPDLAQAKANAKTWGDALALRIAACLSGPQGRRGTAGSSPVVR
ncbi:hypothetical protein AB0K00_52145 [Dactylosporangium sp. NPDC049525]|uniref:hypothetical protein n=1 Tax=Dactylosporangium sp. NPDC049525 TaxID=3154730 RepID=UPI003443B2E6